MTTPIWLGEVIILWTMDDHRGIRIQVADAIRHNAYVNSIREDSVPIGLLRAYRFRDSSTSMFKAVDFRDDTLDEPDETSTATISPPMAVQGLSVDSAKAAKTSVNP
ncbi:MAG: hypothetical protein OXN89_01085 [Bryobacterales bacterium]|nr:hypothetical protein [Bryobacterales bacterium]